MIKNATLKSGFILAFLFAAKLGMAQTTTYQTVGIIGSATANGWNASTPMTRTVTGGHDWTITLPLTAVEVKFRANDDWTVNWGAVGFPTGTGTQGGPNIPITTAGRYVVRFNDVTGAYQFSVASAVKADDAAILKMALAPNPASGSLRVGYNLPVAGTAVINMQNLLGQSVRQFAPVAQAAGAREQQLSLAGIAAGVYLVQLKTNTLVQTTRLVVE